MSSIRSAFEQIAYPSFPRAASTPDRLAAVATLFGVRPPDPQTARVLELGCSDGGNILPLALVTPESSFLGIDITESAVERGKQRIAELKLSNIELQAIDLTQFSTDAGLFDYIIVHGVFSWVPPEVRQGILALLRRHLAPDGVAYVDYNAQPGSQRQYAFRRTMRYHVRRFAEPRDQIAQARALMKLIIDANPHNPEYRQLAETELQSLLKRSDAGVFHDSISEFNEPFYFHEFAALASQHSLQYLGEADVWEMHDSHLAPHIRHHLSTLRSLVDKEQYLDILKNRRFRQTLLCHSGREVGRTLDGTTLSSLLFSLQAEPVAIGPERARIEVGSWVVEVIHPLARAMLDAMVQVFPSRLTASAVIEEVRRSGRSGGASDETFLTMLLQAVLNGVFRIHARPAPFTRTVSARPVASRLARVQAARGVPVSSLDHTMVESLDPTVRRILPLLDGLHDTTEIATALAMDPSVVTAHLRTIARLALLVA